MDTALADALPFRTPPPVISDSESEEVAVPATAIPATGTRPADPPTRMDTRTEHVTMRMRPARTEAAMFDGKEVTEFLDEYNRQANNAGLNDRQKVCILPDYCDNVRRSFVKMMQPYVNQDWPQLQEDMKEHWRDHDTSQQRGTRAYLEAYVQQSSQAFPGISDYYTNFLVTSNAGIASGQVHQAERGFLFFKGLPRTDKELVLFSMPSPHRPNGIDVSTYDMDEIYKFVRMVYRQREGIKQTSYSQAEEDMRRAQLAVQDSRRVTASDIQAAVSELERRRTVGTSGSLPPGVDHEVQDLIDAMKGVKISVQELESLREHPHVGPLLREGRNYVYFLSQVTRSENPPPNEGRTTASFQPQGILSRNDGSYEADQPRNVDPSRGSMRQGRAEYRTSCNMCNEPGHFVRECELYQNLIRMGWISFSYDRDSRRTTWFYGPSHKRLGEIREAPPPSLQLHWLRGKIRDFFEVTDDVLDTPASQCKPEKFDGHDSRPGLVQRPNRGGYRPPTPPNPGQGNTMTIKRAGPEDPAADVDLAEFQALRILDDDEAAEEVMALDYIDRRDIVLGRGGEANAIGAAGAAVRASNRDKQPTDRVLEQVRQSQVQKKRGRPRKEYDADRLQREVSDEPTLRNDQEDAAPTPDYRIDDDSQTIPYPSQLHDDPFAVIRPPEGYRYLSADPDNLQPAKKKKVQFGGLDEDELRSLLTKHPNRIPTAMLKQEVRGVTIADLLGEKAIRKHLEALLAEPEKETSQNAQVNVALSGRREGDASGRASQSAVVGFAKRNLATPDWPTHPTLPNTRQSGRQQNGKEINTAQINLLGQSRHQLTGTWDTWNSRLDQATHREHYENQKVSGVAFVQSDLPTCWASMGAHSIRCLIDTGAQMNLLRRSAALAMKIPYEEMDPETSKEGVVSANGSIDPFIGTAWHVPVKIGQVVTRTHFRIIDSLTRSAILGAPWCASARLSLQYNVFGRVTCRILDGSGGRNATFIASDPAPLHPKYGARVDDDEDSEN
jgi:hypothetical protein